VEGEVFKRYDYFKFGRGDFSKRDDPDEVNKVVQKFSPSIFSTRSHDLVAVLPT